MLDLVKYHPRRHQKFYQLFTTFVFHFSWQAIKLLGASRHSSLATLIFDAL
jgi:hypothetical protein